MIGIDVLHMESPFDARAGGQIDRLMADASFLGKVVITGVGIADEQNVLIEHGWQAFAQLSFADGAFASEEIQGLAGTVPGHQHADLLVGNPSFGGRATPLAGRTVQRACALVGFEEVGLVRLGDAMQVFGPVVLAPGQKTVAPAKAGIAMNADVPGALANGQRGLHRLKKIPPLRLVPKPRQRRPRQGIEGLAAGAAPIALKPLRLTVPMKVCVCAVRALRRGVETGLNSRRRMAITRLTQHLHKPVALPMRQSFQGAQDTLEIKRFHR